MKQKNFIQKIASFGCLACLPLALAACSGENPIDTEILQQDSMYKGHTQNVAAVDSELPNVPVYKCMQKVGDIPDKEIRCKNLIEKMGGAASIDDEKFFNKIAVMVEDTVNYDNDGNRIESSSSAEQSSSSEAVTYLQETKSLSITLTNYEQLKDSISEDKEIGDPEIQFLVKTLINGEASDFDPVTVLVLDTVDVKTWEGSKSVVFQIHRGIDEIQVCPIVKDENEDDDTILLDEMCFPIKDIGLVEDNDVSKMEVENDLVSVKWEWHLYKPSAN